MGVPIICLGCNERAEIPFIPPDLTCVACKTGEHIDLDDSIDVTAVSEWRSCTGGEYRELDGGRAEARANGVTKEFPSVEKAKQALSSDQWVSDMGGAAGDPKHFAALGEPDLPMMLLPAGVPDQDQDVELLRGTDEKRKVTVPQGSAPYSQRALASTKTAGECPNCHGSGSVPAGGGEDPDDVDDGYVQCPTCKGSKTASVTKTADLAGIRNLLAQFNAKNVTVTYDDDLGMHTVSGPLTYHPPAVMVGRSATTDAHVLQITVNGYGDFPDQRTEPVSSGSLVNLLSAFPSGATAGLRTTAGDSVEMTTIPKCDVCKMALAAYDAKLVGLGGSWGYVCEQCFSKYGPGQLGTGNAQRLVQRSAKAASIADAVQQSNPGMTRAAALAVAKKTIARYPKVAAGMDISGRDTYEPQANKCNACGFVWSGPSPADDTCNKCGSGDITRHYRDAG